MKQVAMFDRGDHWEVVADYSQSPRHGSLSEEQWKAEFSGPGYEAMRESQPGLIAAHAPKGMGKWKKDWSGPHVVQSVRLQLACNAAADFDGVPVVPTSSMHVVLAKKVDQDGKLVQGSEPLRVLVSAPVTVAPANVALQGGQTSLTIGSERPCDVTVTVADPSGTIKRSSIALRFR